MFNQDSLHFLLELSQNNNRDWFHANKKRYEEVLKEPAKVFTQNLIEAIQEFDPEILVEPKDVLFRIYRDTRFSKDKTPYKTHVGGLISKHGRRGKEHPGYYFHVEGGRLMLGGGGYFMEKETLLRVRTNIANNPQALDDILADKKFKKHFGEIKGEENKRIPAPFKPVLARQPLIAKKQFYYMAEFPPEKVIGKAGVKFCAKVLASGKVLNDYLVEAMGK